jgi:hypothetical protein
MLPGPRDSRWLRLVSRRRRIAVDGVGADSGVGPVEAGPKTRSGEAGPE